MMYLNACVFNGFWIFALPLIPANVSFDAVPRMFDASRMQLYQNIVFGGVHKPNGTWSQHCKDFRVLLSFMKSQDIRAGDAIVTTNVFELTSKERLLCTFQEDVRSSQHNATHLTTSTNPKCGEGESNFFLAAKMLFRFGVMFWVLNTQRDDSIVIIQSFGALADFGSKTTRFSSSETNANACASEMESLFISVATFPMMIIALCTNKMHIFIQRRFVVRCTD